MSQRSTFVAAALSLLALMLLGCSFLGRLASQAADNATGGAVSTIESLQAGMATAMATLPAEIPGLPGSAPMVTEAPSGGPGTAAGTISGSLSYPSEAIPPLRILAFAADTLEPAATLETAANQSDYRISVPYGAYYVVAYTLDGRLAGGYSSAVICGLRVDCADHTLIPVVVAPGYAPEGIDPADWYAPEGTFPGMP